MTKGCERTFFVVILFYLVLRVSVGYLFTFRRKELEGTTEGQSPLCSTNSNTVMGQYFFGARNVSTGDANKTTKSDTFDTIRGDRTQNETFKAESATSDTAAAYSLRKKFSTRRISKNQEPQSKPPPKPKPRPKPATHLASPSSSHQLESELQRGDFETRVCPHIQEFCTESGIDPEAILDCSSPQYKASWMLCLIHREIINNHGSPRFFNHMSEFDHGYQPLCSDGSSCPKWKQLCALDESKQTDDEEAMMELRCHAFCYDHQGRDIKLPDGYSPMVIQEDFVSADYV